MLYLLIHVLVSKTFDTPESLRKLVLLWGFSSLELGVILGAGDIAVGEQDG